MGKLRSQDFEPTYRAVIAAALTGFRAMGWQLRVYGAEHLPRQGPAVLASNHIGYLDFAFLGYAARERGRLVRFLARKEAFEHPLAGPLMRGMRHIPVDFPDGGGRALEEAVARLRAGEVVGLFPEGTISPSFVPRPGRSGAARIAMAVGAPLVPAAVWGSQRILTKWRPKNFRRGVAVEIHYGPPIDYEPEETPEAVTTRLMDAIRGLLEVAIRDYPQQPDGDDDRWWVPAHLGGSAPTLEEAEVRLAQQQAERRARKRGQPA